MIALLAVAALAVEAPACDQIGLSNITAVEAPAVIVLGERHGTQPDLARAKRVVNALQAAGPVTVALEAVSDKLQPVLDDFAAGKILAEDLKAKLDWDNTWGFPYGPYEPLVTGSLRGVNVVAAGPELGLPLDAPRFPVPPGYLPMLADSMMGHEIPPTDQDHFEKAMAWRDYAIADDALSHWDGKGYLVILTGRGHVEGGKGVAWQIAQRSNVTVKAFVLAWGKNPPCYEDDQLWRPGPLTGFLGSAAR